MPQAVFVYGTLKRGQSREKSWPRMPLSVTTAMVRGHLYDLGRYPGLIDGGDVVAGELWSFSTADMPPTLAVLDEIEGIFGQDDDEYRRVIVECLISNQELPAWTYFYARRAAVMSAQRIMPNNHGLCEWRSPPLATTSLAQPKI